ncbi:MAG: large conductance mechanosensitive channel protein MscL [Acidimicrobiales bacterium]|jgi:large conductance mechanosensitive channel|nr:large conductance mechanosensitive channel protein MscL [Acidimicrobiales bacterium]
MLKEFKDFINRGNVVDLAVAVVMGTAFAAVIKSFTDDILMQVLAIFGGKPDFNEYTITINDAVIRWGTFLTALINFLIVAFAMFLVVKAINRMQAGFRKPEEEAVELEETEVELLRQIRDALTSRDA